MRKLFYIAAIVLFFSCQNKKVREDKEQAPTMTEPSKTVIDSLVKEWYSLRTKPGSPSWSVDSVQVLNMNKESQVDSIYHITFVASGTQSNYSLPDAPPPSNFSDTARLDLVWRGSYWEINR